MRSVIQVMPTYDLATLNDDYQDARVLYECDEDGNVRMDVARNCLRLRDYETTRDGMRKAIADGYGSVVRQGVAGLALEVTPRGVERSEALLSDPEAVQGLQLLAAGRRPA